MLACRGLVPRRLELSHERVQHRPHHLAKRFGAGLPLAIAAAAGPWAGRGALLVLGIGLEQGLKPREDLVAHGLAPYTPQTTRSASLISPTVARARTAARIGSITAARGSRAAAPTSDRA